MENPRDVYNPIQYCPHRKGALFLPFTSPIRILPIISPSFSHFLSLNQIPSLFSFLFLTSPPILFPFSFPHFIFPPNIINFSSLLLPFLPHISFHCYSPHFPLFSCVSSLNLEFVVPFSLTLPFFFFSSLSLALFIFFSLSLRLLFLSAFSSFSSILFIS